MLFHDIAWSRMCVCVCVWGCNPWNVTGSHDLPMARRDIAWSWMMSQAISMIWHEVSWDCMNTLLIWHDGARSRVSLCDSLRHLISHHCRPHILWWSMILGTMACYSMIAPWYREILHDIMILYGAAWYCKSQVTTKYCMILWVYVQFCRHQCAASCSGFSVLDCLLQKTNSVQWRQEPGFGQELPASDGLQPTSKLY